MFLGSFGLFALMSMLVLRRLIIKFLSKRLCSRGITLKKYDDYMRTSYGIIVSLVQILSDDYQGYPPRSNPGLPRNGLRP